MTIEQATIQQQEDIQNDIPHSGVLYCDIPVGLVEKQWKHEKAEFLAINGFQQLLSDVESTVTTTEAFHVWGDERGLGKEAREATNGAMGGHSQFKKSVDDRLRLVRPTSEMLNEVSQRYVETLVPGAVKTHRLAQELGVKGMFVSMGFEHVMELIRDTFQMPVIAGKLFKNTETGFFTHTMDMRLGQDGGKKYMIGKLDRKGKIRHPVVMIGDSTSDTGVGRVEDKDRYGGVDMIIHFYGCVDHPKARAQSDVSIKHFSTLLPILLGEKRWHLAATHRDPLVRALFATGVAHIFKGDGIEFHQKEYAFELTDRLARFVNRLSENDDAIWPRPGDRPFYKI